MSAPFLCWAVSCLTALLGSRAAIAYAKRLGILDMPGELKLHTTETPRFGGIGIVLGVFVTISGLFLLYRHTHEETFKLLLLGMPVILTGALDDVYTLTPLAKLVGQLASCLGAAALIVRGSVSAMNTESTLMWSMALGGVLCFLTNSVNLLDGMDGLAAGSVATMSIAHVCTSLLAAQRGLDVYPAAVSGACMGFLTWNLPPAKTFMGDVGSLFLGYSVGINSLRILVYDGFSISKMFGVALTLAVPVSDTSLAIVRRFLLHRSMMCGDRMHIYDCLYRRFGGDTKRTMIVMWAITLLTSLGGVVATVSSPVWSIALALVGYGSVLGVSVKLGRWG